MSVWIFVLILFCAGGLYASGEPGTAAYFVAIAWGWLCFLGILKVQPRSTPSTTDPVRASDPVRAPWKTKVWQVPRYTRPAAARISDWLSASAPDQTTENRAEAAKYVSEVRRVLGRDDVMWHASGMLVDGQGARLPDAPYRREKGVLTLPREVGGLVLAQEAGALVEPTPKNDPGDAT